MPGVQFRFNLVYIPVDTRQDTLETLELLLILVYLLLQLPSLHFAELAREEDIEVVLYTWVTNVILLY